MVDASGLSPAAAPDPLLVDSLQNNIKDQGRVGFYVTSDGAVSVGQFRWNVKPEIITYRHQLQTLGPAGYDSIERKADTGI